MLVYKVIKFIKFVKVVKSDIKKEGVKVSKFELSRISL